MNLLTPGLSALLNTVEKKTVERVVIEVLNKQETATDYKIECQFNPTKFSVAKGSNWKTKGEGEGGGSSKKDKSQSAPGRNAPKLDFAGGESATFDLDLMFDTSRYKGSERDVRVYTNQLLKLTLKPKGEDQPRVVKIKWGKLQLFKAVVTKVSITYTLFDTDGMPVRATAKVDFKQKDESDDVTKGQNPTSRTEARQTRLIKHGDRLDLIAYEEYNHVAHWRYLAQVNNLRDPRDLRPGQILVVPPLP